MTMMENGGRQSWVINGFVWSDKTSLWGVILPGYQIGYMCVLTPG